jgi:hypothetical protein
MKSTPSKASRRKRARVGRLVLNKVATEAPAAVRVNSKRVFVHLTGNTKTALIRNDEMMGKKYVVVPMVMMTVGVHNGSQGPLYYPADELGKTPQVWNHKPVVVYHPEINGEGVSACDPDILSTYSIGVIMNTKFDAAGRLTAEAWIEEDRANAVDKRIMEAVKNKKMMEVSTGLYTDNLVPKEGEDEFEGEKFDYIAVNHRPDHLALLPDQIGACSMKDGAGFIRNHAGAMLANLDPKKREAAFEAVTNALKGLNLLEASYEQKRDMLASALQKKYPAPNGLATGYSYPWIEAVFDDYIIFCMGGKLFKLTYSSTDGSVTLAGDASEVIRVTEYKSAKDGAYVGNEQPDKQPNQNTTMDKKKIVDGLIGNAASGFTEADRSYLMGLDEARLTAFASNADKASKAAPAAAPAANAAPAASETAKPAAVEAAKAPALNADDQAALDYGKRQLAANKAALISRIKANKNNKFSDATLNGMGIETLESLAELAGGPAAQGTTDYSLSGGSAPAANTDAKAPEPLAVPTMNFSEEQANA